MTPLLRILIVCEHASAQFGGEAALPLHYFRIFRRRGYPVWLITHARTREELKLLFPGEDRILYIEDTKLHRLMWRAGSLLPSKLANFSVGYVSRLACQLAQRRLARRLIAQQQIDVVHQPMPVSPREPSLMHGLGAPVIIGPMNGGLDYPPAFRGRSPRLERWFMLLGRLSASAFNWLMPGKRRASVLLVANPRTRRALPAGACRCILEIPENGVDLSLWTPGPPEEPRSSRDRPITFLFLGRLVGCKAVDLLLHAFEQTRRHVPARLLVVGDGPERSGLERLSSSLGLGSDAKLPGSVTFTGWLSQAESAQVLRQADCLILPSLHECGGAVVLEAMSAAKPIIATEWGGPTDYLDDTCGVLVPPQSREELISGFAEAMVRLAGSAELRLSLGQRGREKVLAHYDWELKVDRILQIYVEARATYDRAHADGRRSLSAPASTERTP